MSCFTDGARSLSLRSLVSVLVHARFVLVMCKKRDKRRKRKQTQLWPLSVSLSVSLSSLRGNAGSSNPQGPTRDQIAANKVVPLTRSHCDAGMSADVPGFMASTRHRAVLSASQSLIIFTTCSVRAPRTTSRTGLLRLFVYWES